MSPARALLTTRMRSLSSFVLLVLLPTAALGAERTAKPSLIDTVYLNGELAGHPQAAEGGYPTLLTTSVITAGDQYANWATLQAVGYEAAPLTVRFAAEMLPGWYSWLSQELGVNPAPPIPLTLLRSNGTLRESQVSAPARLLEIEFPALDRAVVGTAHFRARLEFQGQPQVVFSPPGPAPVSGSLAPSPPTSHDFRFNLQGMEATTAQTVTVSGFTVARSAAGSTLAPFMPTPISVRLAQSAAAGLQDWYAASVLSGNSSPVLRQGLIEYMDGRGRVVSTVGLVNVRMLGFNPLSHNGVPLIEVTLLAERIGPPTPAAGT